MDRCAACVSGRADFLRHVEVGTQLHVYGRDGGVWSSRLLLVEDAPAAHAELVAWWRSWPVISATVWRSGELVASWAS